MAKQLSSFLASVAVTYGAQKAVDHLPANLKKSLERVNFKGETITLAGGMAAGAGSLIFSAVNKQFLLLAGQSLVVASGALDDLLEAKWQQHIGADAKVAKGFKGHLGALSRGEVTTGNLKILGIGTGAVLIALAAGKNSIKAPGRSVANSDASRRQIVPAFFILVDTFNTAALANLINLFDLRPGRALKTVTILQLLASLVPGNARTPQVKQQAAAQVGRILALLPADLKARTMLGDTGANILGANLGYFFAEKANLPGKLLLGTGAAGLILLSEKMSFSKVIAKTPWLDFLDQLGRDQLGREPN